MRREKQLELLGQPVTVRELTVGEVRAWLADAEGQVQRDADGMPDIVGMWLLEDCTFGDLMQMSSASRDLLDSATESDLLRLVACCRELNPGFFGLRARLMAIGQRALDQSAPAISPSPSAG